MSLYYTPKFSEKHSIEDFTLREKRFSKFHHSVFDKKREQRNLNIMFRVYRERWEEKTSDVPLRSCYAPCRTAPDCKYASDHVKLQLSCLMFDCKKINCEKKRNCCGHSCVRYIIYVNLVYGWLKNVM